MPGPNSHHGMRPEIKVLSTSLTADEIVRASNGLTPSPLPHIAPVGKDAQTQGKGTVPAHPRVVSFRSRQLMEDSNKPATSSHGKQGSPPSHYYKAFSYRSCLFTLFWNPREALQGMQGPPSWAARTCNKFLSVPSVQCQVSCVWRS